MTTLPPTLSKSYAVGLPSPQKIRKSYAVNFDPPPNRSKLYAVCPTLYQDMTFQLKSINFTTKIQYDGINFAKNGRFAPIFASINIKSHYLPDLNYYIVDMFFFKVWQKFNQNTALATPSPSLLNCVCHDVTPSPCRRPLPSPQRPSALTRMSGCDPSRCRRPFTLPPTAGW